MPVVKFLACLDFDDKNTAPFSSKSAQAKSAQDAVVTATSAPVGEILSIKMLSAGSIHLHVCHLLIFYEF
jgi:hypothetical protein